MYKQAEQGKMTALYCRLSKEDFDAGESNSNRASEGNSHKVCEGPRLRQHEVLCG